MALNETDLCKLAYKYGTDKCPKLKHNYTPYYHQLLNSKRNQIKKVLELGIGRYKGMETNPVIFDKGLNRYYHRGASLYMWRDYFPNAYIYGADVAPETIFTDDRIKTFLCDERKNDDLTNLVSTIGKDIDLVIDDASHHVGDQIFACQKLMPLLKKEVVYIIEDVSHPAKISAALEEKYRSHIPSITNQKPGNMLMVIENT